jgi:YidC/Oxa1 family membrane protein insertase
MIYRTGAFDHFDSVFCAGPHHIEELQTLERIGGLKKKLLVEHGYGRLDAIRREAEQRPAEAVVDATEPLHVLVAPSWGPNGVIETIGLELTNTLLEAGFSVTVRPHPQTAKLSPATTAAIREKFYDHDHFTYEYGVSGQESLHRSDIMISDWSGAALEYAFGLGKPVMFVDVPRKINNPYYLAVGIEPFEASIREKIGGILNPADLAELPEKLREQCASWDPEELPIHEYVFNLLDADKVGAKAIIRQAKALVSSKA